MGFRGKRNRVILCSILIIAMFTVFSPNVQFQLSVVHAGDWETVEYIDSMDALQTEDPIMIEGELVHQEFIMAVDETNYADATQSQLYGSTTPDPPSGMGVDDTAHSTLQEASYVSTSYTTVTSYTGGTLPAGWTNTDWIFGTTYASIMGISLTGGNFYTAQHDMSSYDGVRVKFDWMNDGYEDTELGELTCNSYEGGNNVWFSSPAGNQGTFTNQLRDSAWASTLWRVTFTASGLTGDVESWEGFRVDNIYLQGKVDSTYYRFEAVYRFDTVEYSYGIERLYIDYDAGTSQEGLQYYAGITTSPSSWIGSTSGAEPDTNFDITDELTGTPFYVKIVDSTQSGDTDQDSWLIDRLYVYVENNPPVADTDAACVNLDDTDNLYGGSGTYFFTANVSDPDGAEDISSVDIRSYDYDITTLRWRVVYSGSGWIVTDGVGIVEVDSVNSEVVLDGNNMDVTFWLNFTFETPIWTDDDLVTSVVDNCGYGDFDTTDCNYDYDSRLDWFVTPVVTSDDAGTVDHGDLDETFIISGTLEYYGSTSHVKPDGYWVDVWVIATEYGTNVGPWSDTYTPNGEVSVTCYADNVVGEDTYTIKPVRDGNTHGGLSLYYDTSDITDTYIADSLTITITGPTDNRQNINANASGMVVSAVYQYPDSSQIFDGTLTLNNTDYNGDGTAVRWGYTVSSPSSDTHGVTAISTNDETFMIWDRVQVQSYTVTDDWVNINDNVNIDFLVWYDYDDTPVTDGDFTLNGYDAAHLGSGVWRITRTSASPALVTYNTVLVSAANTHGIDAEDQNSKSRQVVWDSVTISMTNPTDQRQDINANATGIIITITMDYNGTTYGGTATMNNTDYNGDGSVVRWGYTVSSVNGGTEGITTISSNDETYMIWDRIYVVSMTYTGTPDTRINIGTTINFDWELHYDYDEVDVADGTHTINGYALAYQGSGIWRYSNSSSVVGDLLLDSIALGGDDTYDITEMFMNSEEVTMIWDRILILTTVVHDARIDYGTQSIISVTAQLEYTAGGTHSLGSGDTLYMNDTVMSWNGTHFILNPQFALVNIWSFFVNSSSANEATYGITVINLDGNSANVIWDRVIWNMYTRNATVDAGRLTNCTSVNIGETVNITARFLFEHDSTAVTSGTILLEGESMTYIANGYWYLLVSNATAQFGMSYQWDSFVTTGNTHGITVENANSKDFYIIWDSIYIFTHGVEPDARHDVGEYPTLWATAKLTYDDDVLDTTSDYIKLAGQTFQWNGSYLVNNTFTLWQVGQFTLYTNDTGHYEATYGITEIEYYSFTTIFDRVYIYAMWSPTEADNRTNYGDTETVYVSFVSEYDNSSMTAGTFELNSTGMSYVSGSIWQKTGYSYSEVVNYTFNVNSASWSAYDIDEINYNGWNVTYYYIVWDRVKILTTVADDSRLDISTNSEVRVTAELEYDGVTLGSGDSLYVDDLILTWDGTNSWFDRSYSQSSVDIWNYYVNTSNVNEATYGITYLNLNGQSVNIIWDRVYLTGIFVSDSRASYGTDVNVTVTAKSEYNDDVLGSGDSIYINGTLATWDSTHSVFNVTYSYDEVVNKTFHVTAVTEATYDITALTNDTYVWIIWDRLKITDFALDNVIPDPLQMVFVNLSIIYEYDSAEFHFDNGTITMIAYNVTWDVEEEKNMHWNDTNWQFNHTMPSGVGVIRNFNISAYLDGVYGIAVINWNGFDNVTAGSDRVLVVSYTVSDDRDDINDYIWLNVTLQLESNGTAIVDGDVVVNGYIFTHISGGNWRYNTTQSSVLEIVFDTVVAENNSYGIETVNQNGQYTSVIWDRIVITNFWVIDNRTDVDTVVQIRLTAELDFDDTPLGSGDTIYINSTLATWDAINLRFYISENYGTALNYTYALTSITETAYTITEVTNTSYIWQIWDQFVLTRFDSSDADGRTNLDETEYIHFGMKWDFDDEIFQSGNGTIYLNSTLMTWNASQTCWTFSWVESAPVSYLFEYASHTDSVYGITAIDWGAYDNVTQTWDRIGVVVATNMTWTVVGYNVMISYTSTYESDGVTWGGNATIANTSMVSGSRPRNENLTFTTVTNKTFYATAISVDPNGVIGFTTTTVWCVWDNMTANAMYGADVTEYSKTFIVLFGELSWQHNSSGIGVDWVCLNIRNGTSLNWATSLADNYLEPLKQELPIPLDWEVILYSNNATKTINGRYYNFQWFSVEQTVVLGQSVMVEGDEILDTTIVVSGTTNVDFTWTIYNELVATGETGSVSGVNDWEISFSRNVTYGLYNFSIHFDASLSGNRWYNSSYFNDFVLSIEIPEQVDDYMEIKGTSSLDCEWYVYNRDTLDWTGEDDTITGGNDYFLFQFLMQTAAGKHNYSLYFNISTVVFIWHNGSYYIAPTVFDVDIEDFVLHDDYIEITGISKLATAWYVFNEGIYSGESGSETAEIGFTFSFVKNTSVGKHNFSIYFNDTIDGLDYRWYNRSYTISAVYADCSVVLYGPDGIGIDLILFKIYVNDVEYTGSSITFYGRTDATHNITILNYFDEVVGTDNNVMPDDRVIHVAVSVYAFKIYNQMDEEYIYFSMTSSAGATWSEHVGPREIVKFQLYGGNAYTYTFTALVGPDKGTFTGNVNISIDTGMIITGYSLPDIYAGLLEVGGGTGLDLTDIQNVIIAQTGGLLNQIQFFTWLTALMIFLGLYIVPYISKQRKKGEEIVIPELGETIVYEDEYDAHTGATRTVRKTKKKKGPVPKQLEEYTFKEGPMNPKFKGKNMLDDMSDQIWDKLQGKRKKRE